MTASSARGLYLSFSPPTTCTTTFFSPPSGAATTSSVLAPWSCGQLGSAFMLIGSGAGAVPLSLTVPLITPGPATAVLVAAAALPGAVAVEAGGGGGSFFAPHPHPTKSISRRTGRGRDVDMGGRPSRGPPRSQSSPPSRPTTARDTLASLMAAFVPDRARFLDLARKGRLCFVYREWLADSETPVSVY